MQHGFCGCGGFAGLRIGDGNGDAVEGKVFLCIILENEIVNKKRNEARRAVSTKNVQAFAFRSKFVLSGIWDYP